MQAYVTPNFPGTPFSATTLLNHSHITTLASKFFDLGGVYNQVSKGIKMGGSFSKIMSKLFANREMRILMLGLDAAGKTSTRSPPFLSAKSSKESQQFFTNSSWINSITRIVFRTWLMTRRVTTIPTVGFNVETVTYKNVKFNVWVPFPFLVSKGQN